MHHLAKVAYGLHRTGGSNPPLSANPVLSRRMITCADRDGHNRTGDRRRLGICMPRIWALMICAILTGCAGPSLEVATDPADAELFVDGRLTAAGEPLPFRYYGDILLHAEPPMEDGEFRHLGLRQTVSVSEPVTPWVFPLDFALELMLRPFTGADDQSVTLGLTENPTRVLEGLEPPGAEDIRARSYRARVDR